VKTKSQSRNPFRLLVKYFLEGLFVLLPLTITVVVIIWLADFFSKQLGPQTIFGGYLKMLGIRIAGESLPAYVIGWLAVIGAVIILGFLVNLGAKKYISKSIDLIMQRIPLINKLYKVSVQIVDMIDKKEKEDFKGMSVVYVFFGAEKGAAFLALMPTKEKYVIRDTVYHIVLIPSAPVPVGGSMMLVPADSIEPAEMSIEDFMQVYVSMGASSSDILPKFKTF